MEENNTGTTGNTETTGKTFTQEEVNAIIETRLVREREKYADYEDLKGKAEKFDEFEESRKSELQKATEKANELEKKLHQMESANKTRDTRNKIAKETGVPADLLTGTDEESCKKQAQAILEFSGRKTKNYPGTRENSGKRTDTSPQDAAMREFARQLFNRE